MSAKTIPVLAAAAIIAALLAGGCATSGSGPGATALTAGTAKPIKKKGLLSVSRVEIGSFAEDGSYRPSGDERGLNCRRIRGKMSIRIAQLRSNNRAKDASAVSRAISGIIGGPERGLDVQAQSRRDRAILVAYNRLLAAKKCPAVDLDAALSAAPGAAQGSAVPPQTR